MTLLQKVLNDNEAGLCTSDLSQTLQRSWVFVLKQWYCWINRQNGNSTEKGVGSYHLGNRKPASAAKVLTHLGFIAKRKLISSLFKYLIFPLHRPSLLRCLIHTCTHARARARAHTHTHTHTHTDTHTPLLLLFKKEMETHSSIRAGKIPWTEEPGGL